MQIRHYKSLPLVPVMNKMSQLHSLAYYSVLLSTVTIPYNWRHKRSYRFRFNNKVRLVCLPQVSVACYMPLLFYPPIRFTIYLKMFYSLMINNFLCVIFSDIRTSSEFLLLLLLLLSEGILSFSFTFNSFVCDILNVFFG